MEKKILMKFTSRGRYEVLKKCVQTYYDMALNEQDMLWVFSVDNDDETFKKEDFNIFLHNLKIDYIICTANSHGKIDAINRDVALISKDWDIILNISDDQLPVIFGYDNVIRETMPDDLDASLWFNDGHQSRINTQEILGRKYYENQGYIYYPEYRSFFCDDESTQVAFLKGKMIKKDISLIQHFHPDWGFNNHIQQDELYNRNSKHWKHDEMLFESRKEIIKNIANV
jgi:hypothetical protein